MNKLNLGLAYYGYSYILENTSCKEPGCPATGAAKTTGPCGETTGSMDIGEIQQIVTNNSITPKMNKDAAVMYFSWDENHWYVLHFPSLAIPVLMKPGCHTTTARRCR